jgi:hypothetical protein
MTWWYAGWFRVFGVSSLVAQWSHIPLSLGVTWATFRLARQVTGSLSAATWAGLMVAWYPTFLGYVLTTPYYHYLYTVMTVLMVWALYRFWIIDFGFWIGGFAFFAGVTAGAGALTKAVQLIAPLQMVTWLVVMACALSFRSLPWRKWAGGVLAFGVGMLLVLAPWMARNERVFGEVVPICTSGGLVLYSANNPESNGLYSGMPDAVLLMSPTEMLAHSRWCSDRAKAFMKHEPALFLNLVGRKFLHTWGSEATFTELINWRGESTAWIKMGFSFVFLSGWAGLVFLWGQGAIRQLRQRAPLSSYEVLMGVALLSNALVYVIFEGGDRHHLPFVPLIVVLVAAMHRGRFKTEPEMNP